MEAARPKDLKDMFLRSVCQRCSTDGETIHSLGQDIDVFEEGDLRVRKWS